MPRASLALFLPAPAGSSGIVRWSVERTPETARCPLGSQGGKGWVSSSGFRVVVEPLWGPQKRWLCLPEAWVKPSSHLGGCGASLSQWHWSDMWGFPGRLCGFRPLCRQSRTTCGSQRGRCVEESWFRVLYFTGAKSRGRKCGPLSAGWLMLCSSQMCDVSLGWRVHSLRGTQYPDGRAPSRSRAQAP